MKIINLQDIKTKGAKALDKDQPNYLVINSKAEYVITSKDQYDAMEKIVEDYEDILAFRERKDDEVVDLDEFVKTVDEL
ncbi:MAG TPA: hypothetical protein VGA67_02995 [Candidatus Dojkabacteria bacterium]|jgi:hypothetical protein